MAHLVGMVGGRARVSAQSLRPLPSRICYLSWHPAFSGRGAARQVKPVDLRRQTVTGPSTAVELRALCRGWPSTVVQSAITTVLYDRQTNVHHLTSEALAALVVAWLLYEDEDSEPPPLSEGAVREIWNLLSSALH